MTTTPTEITIKLDDADWLKLCILLRYLRDEATTQQGAEAVSDLALNILMQGQRQLPLTSAPTPVGAGWSVQ